MSTISEPLYRRVRKDIVECALTPGKSFSEAELGRLYHASRTPVREACRRLEHEGLVRIIPFRGYSIAPLSVAEFHDLQEMQLIFEPATAALAAERANQKELDEMRELATYEYNIEDKNSYHEFLQTNYQLHSLIAQSSKNKRLSDVVSNIHVRLMRFFYLGLSFESHGPTLVAEHISLVEAIRNRDIEQARHMATDHISKAIERSAKLLMGAIRFGEAVFEASPEMGDSQLARKYIVPRI
ncbi:GntR family transcriptional regulator [Granulicella sp. dw_53]|uniref:GntR family transcriptional regulator n=1 Tax=Granulicella sp. dw_53 TaxID=2719792 RepID=UPI001BD60783|nr:GntR family transcriptional regulator [Granulicella sp. dw_53]